MRTQIEGRSAISTRFEGKIRKNNRELVMEIELLSVSGFDGFVISQRKDSREQVEEGTIGRRRTCAILGNGRIEGAE
jgi:hypothetical protein